MISRAAHAGQILTLWTILAAIVWPVALWVERTFRLLILSWADVHEWTETKNPDAGSSQTPGMKPMNWAI